MIGKFNREVKQVSIIGSGFAGLVAAYYLDRSGFEVTLHEQKPQAGGLLGTIQTHYGIAERAAHSFLATQAIQDLCAELGVELTPVREDSRARFIFRGLSLKRLPLNIFEICGLVWRACLKRSKGSEEGMNLEEWTLAHLGPGALHHLIGPFLNGIYAATPRELSVSAVFPSLVVPKGKTFFGHLLKRAFGSISTPKSKKQMCAPLHGMSALTGALEKHLATRLQERFVRGAPLTELPKDVLRSQNVFICTPAAEASRLLIAECPELSSSLAQIEYAPLVSVTVFVDLKNLKRTPKGVGVLFSTLESKTVLGVLFNSSAFQARVSKNYSETEMCSLTVMLGGSTRPEAVMMSDDQIRREVTRALEILFGLNGPLTHMEVSRWPRAIPIYSHELEKTWALAAQTWCKTPGRILFGNYTGGVSLRAMTETAATFDMSRTS